MSNELEHSYDIFIQAAPQQVWEALTSSKFTTQYYFGLAVDSEWHVGSDYAMTTPDGATVRLDGKIIESDPPRRLIQTVNVKWDPALRVRKEMTVGWDIEQMGEACRVTVTHKAFASDAKVFEVLTGHCAQLLSGMKTLLETGKPLRVGQPAAAGI